MSDLLNDLLKIGAALLFVAFLVGLLILVSADARHHLAREVRWRRVDRRIGSRS